VRIGDFANNIIKQKSADLKQFKTDVFTKLQDSANRKSVYNSMIGGLQMMINDDMYDNLKKEEKEKIEKKEREKKEEREGKEGKEEGKKLQEWAKERKEKQDQKKPEVKR
jgi:hypothetical protein